MEKLEFPVSHGYTNFSSCRRSKEATNPTLKSHFLNFMVQILAPLVAHVSKRFT